MQAKKCKIETSFLEEDALHWMGDAAFGKGKKIISQLKMVNDVAKRGVKLKSDFNDFITRDDDQKQFLFKLLESIGKSFQTSTN